MTSPAQVAVVGSGLIGQAWALVFARGGCEVRLWDGDSDALARATELVASLAGELGTAGLVDDVRALLDRIRPVADLAVALEGVDHVQENLPERVELKREIFARMDALAPPQATLGSSTSTIPASAFTEGLPGRSRCLVAHPVNPPYLIPVVELCGAPWTDPATVERCRVLMARIGQKPVIVNRELEGFVLNRLQGALLREAVRLVDQGVIDVDDLDVTIRDGLGLRWCFMGPFETIDLNAPAGLADYCERYGEVYRSIAAGQVSTDPWQPELVARLHAERRRLLPQAQMEERRTWRDRRLMMLARHKREAENSLPETSRIPFIQGQKP